MLLAACSKHACNQLSELQHMCPAMVRLSAQGTASGMVWAAGRPPDCRFKRHDFPHQSSCKRAWLLNCIEFARLVLQNDVQDSICWRIWCLRSNSRWGWRAGVAVAAGGCGCFSATVLAAARRREWSGRSALRPVSPWKARSPSSAAACDGVAPTYRPTNPPSPSSTGGVLAVGWHTTSARAPVKLKAVTALRALARANV